MVNYDLKLKRVNFFEVYPFRKLFVFIIPVNKRDEFPKMTTRVLNFIFNLITFNVNYRRHRDSCEVLLTFYHTKLLLFFFSDNDLVKEFLLLRNGEIEFRWVVDTHYWILWKYFDINSQLSWLVSNGCSFNIYRCFKLWFKISCEIITVNYNHLLLLLRLHFDNWKLLCSITIY